MKRILIFLAVIILLCIGPASAYGYIHTLTNSLGENDPYSSGIALRDTVTPSTGKFDGYMMRFKWEYQDRGHPPEQIAFSYIRQNKYADIFTPTKAGSWKIEAQEYIKTKSSDDDKKKSIGRKSEKIFSVIQAPEFGALGLAVPLFLVGLFYIGLRKRMP